MARFSNVNFTSLDVTGLPSLQVALSKSWNFHFLRSEDTCHDFANSCSRAPDGPIRASPCRQNTLISRSYWASLMFVFSTVATAPNVILAIRFSSCCGGGATIGCDVQPEKAVLNSKTNTTRNECAFFIVVHPCPLSATTIC
ncbi:hypothetical protein [Methanosarcina sp. UBA289]|uniref:hypothetical protein n=1 Tax=Methanosarcina sp. UBA289 TaxID=1915574 RepID=UPI0025E8861D|nr:hypothetical protein [Methanosarcina sp. UBA289]